MRHLHASSPTDRDPRPDRPRRGARLALPALATLSIVAACGGDPPPPPPPPTVLEVEVVDAATGAPLPAAHVLVDGAWREVDAAGRLSLTVAPGPRRLRAQADLHLPHPRPLAPPVEVEVPEARTTVSRLALEPRPGAVAGGLLRGRVLRGGAPVEGALVVALSTSEVAGHTDREGRYVIPAPASTYVVSALLGGHASTSVAGVQARAGEVTEVGDVVLAAAPGQRVEGALDARTASVAIALVHPATDEPIPGLATAAAAGAFALDGVPAGAHALRGALEVDGLVLRPDPLLQARPFPVVVGDAAPPALALATVPAVAALAPTAGATVSATPTLSFRPHPAADFHVVEVLDAAGRSVWGGFDARGSWRFTVLPPLAEIRYEGPALEPGQAYRWRVFAAERDPVVPTAFSLVAASEEREGTFRVAR